MTDQCPRAFDETLISGHLDGELTQAAQQKVRLHLQDCGHCRALLSELQAMRETTISTVFSTPDDDQWDEAVRASTEEAEAAAGDDVGTPVIAWEVDGQWKGFFGPVIPSLPDTEQALRLWDGFVMLVETPGFFELKRTRTRGPAVGGDVTSLS